MNAIETERGAGPPKLAAPDLMRIEPFGASFYRRADASFFVLPSPEAQLLLASAKTGLSVIDLYARAPDAWALPLPRFLLSCARWRAEGLVDAADRVVARILRAPRTRALPR
ncbi:MAG: hypothetical protein ACO3JL_19350, partial [Myxococcota bacterium]